MIIERLKGFWRDDLELEHRQVIIRNAIEQIEDLREALALEQKTAGAEIEKLHREAAIRIDQIEREQEAHLRTIADYNKVVVEIERLRSRTESAEEAYVRLDAAMGRLKGAFRVNMLRAFPHMSHDEIDAEIAAAIRESGDE